MGKEKTIEPRTYDEQDYTHRTESVDCPWCGHVHWDDLHEFAGRNDGDEETVYCSECNKDFIAETHVDICYTTRRPGEKIL